MPEQVVMLEGVAGEITAGIQKILDTGHKVIYTKTDYLCDRNFDGKVLGQYYSTLVIYEEKKKIPPYTPNLKEEGSADYYTQDVATEPTEDESQQELE